MTGTKCKQNVFGGRDPSQYLLQPPSSQFCVSNSTKTGIYQKPCWCWTGVSEGWFTKYIPDHHHRHPIRLNINTDNVLICRTESGGAHENGHTRATKRPNRGIGECWICFCFQIQGSSPWCPVTLYCSSHLAFSSSHFLVGCYICL